MGNAFVNAKLSSRYPGGYGLRSWCLVVSAATGLSAAAQQTKKQPAPIVRSKPSPPLTISIRQ